MKSDSDLHALAALAAAALAREPVPWTAFEDEVHGPPDVDTPRGHDPVNRIATNLYFAETATYVAAASPDVARELVARVLAAEGALHDAFEFLLKKEPRSPLEADIKAILVRRAVESQP